MSVGKNLVDVTQPKSKEEPSVIFAEASGVEGLTSLDIVRTVATNDPEGGWNKMKFNNIKIFY